MNADQIASVARCLERNTIPIPFCGCWVWVSPLAQPYPQISICGRRGARMAAHRAAYLAFKGDIPHGSVVRHTCDITTCCNPEHLVIGTTLDNIMDCVERGRHRNQNTLRQFCKNGHPLSGGNVRIEPSGFRRCMSCAAAYQQAWRLNKREKQS